MVTKLSKIKALILDFDGTLVDYYLNEEKALADVFQTYNFNVEDYQPAIHYYQKINENLWKDFEKGNIDMEEIRRIRFEKLLQRFEISADPLVVNSFYLKKFVEHVPVDDLAMIGLLNIKKLIPNIHVAILTNGAHEVQIKRIDRLGYSNVVDKIYTSGSLGYSKPDLRAFKPVIKNLGVNKTGIWMVGDSYSSDIIGAHNVGINSVYIGSELEIDSENGIKPDIICNHFSNFARFLTKINKYK